VADGTLVGVFVGVLTGFVVPLPIAAMALAACAWRSAVSGAKPGGRLLWPAPVA